ncbi:MAG: hypothetical protein NTY75_01910 [Candidatus Shapirobacteria bacterium]|nr:hypothetical protein [Candidatus Shapirobacteria bacterium]
MPKEIATATQTSDICSQTGICRIENGQLELIDVRRVNLSEICMSLAGELKESKENCVTALSKTQSFDKPGNTANFLTGFEVYAEGRVLVPAISDQSGQMITVAVDQSNFVKMIAINVTERGQVVENHTGSYILGGTGCLLGLLVFGKLGAKVLERLLRHRMEGQTMVFDPEASRTMLTKEQKDDMLGAGLGQYHKITHGEGRKVGRTEGGQPK